MVKNSFIEKTYVNSNVNLSYVTENKEENYLEIYIFHVSCPLSLPPLNIPNIVSEYDQEIPQLQTANQTANQY